MTVREVVTEFCLSGDRVEALEAINNLCRAAIAERDAAWLKALKAYTQACAESVGVILWDALTPGEPEIHECESCAPLRDLLDAAARSAHQESPKNPSERTE